MIYTLYINGQFKLAGQIGTISKYLTDFAKFDHDNEIINARITKVSK